MISDMRNLRECNERLSRTISSVSFVLLCVLYSSVPTAIADIAQMFHPSVNRLAGFLEFGALTIALAQSGGAQYKAGFLYLEGMAPKGAFARRSAGWRDKKKQRWCAVRESYLVAMEEMGEVS